MSYENAHCANRLLVFRACKGFMHMWKRAPSTQEIAIKLDVSQAAAKKEMRALNGATGLPYLLNRQNMKEDAI